MTTDTDIGHGTKFGHRPAGSASNVAYTFLARVANVDPGGVTVDPVEDTTLDSPEGYREYLPGLKQATPSSLVLRTKPGSTAQAALAGLLGVVKDFCVEFKNGSKLEFTGFMSELTTGSVTPEGLLEQSATFTKSGKPTQSAAT